MTKKSALLIGASGLVGGQLLKLLLEGRDYERVVILVRGPIGIQDAKLEEIIVDFDRLNTVKAKFAVNDVFCCLGTTIKKAKTREAMNRVDYEYPVAAAKLAREMGAEQYAIVSSLGANPDSSVWYLRMKGTLEHDLKAVGFPSLYLFQPSLLIGERKEFRASERFGAMLSPLFSFLFIGKLKKYKAIPAAAVARGMYQAAQLQRPGVTTYESDEIFALGGTRPGSS